MRGPGSLSPISQCLTRLALPPGASVSPLQVVFEARSPLGCREGWLGQARCDGALAHLQALKLGLDHELSRGQHCRPAWGTGWASGLWGLLEAAFFASAVPAGLGRI